MIMIMKKAAFLFILTSCAFSLFAQKNKKNKNGAIIVVGKVLNQRDSIQVKDLFFEGLHEKMLMQLLILRRYLK
jgi:hypothetical protein